MTEAVDRVRIPSPATVRRAFRVRNPQLPSARFSFDARVALAVDAPAEAGVSGHTFVGSEHVLLGLLREGNTAQPVLNRLGVNIARVRQEIGSRRDMIDRSVTGDIPLSPGVRRTIDIALIRADQRGRARIRGRDLLSAMVEESKQTGSLAGDILQDLGVTLKKLQAS